MVPVQTALRRVVSSGFILFASMKKLSDLKMQLTICGQNRLAGYALLGLGKMFDK